VPGHIRIDGNEMVDELARQDSSHPLTGHETAFGISTKVDRGVIRDWTSSKYKEYWKSIRGQKPGQRCS